VGLLQAKSKHLLLYLAIKAISQTNCLTVVNLDVKHDLLNCKIPLVVGLCMQCKSDMAKAISGHSTPKVL